MAKTIKFNLICDGVPVRTIEELQNNFSVEDILEYYKNGLLKKWLFVRGYNKELKKVETIKEVDPEKIIIELIQIFNIECDLQKIKKDLYIFSYEKARNEQNNLYREKGEKIQRIIDREMQKYESLVEELTRGFHEDIWDISDRFWECKAVVQEIVTYYNWIFKKDSRKIFYKLTECDNWLAIMCLLMNEETRKCYIPASVDEKRLKLEKQDIIWNKIENNIEQPEEFDEKSQGQIYKDKLEMYQLISSKVGAVDSKDNFMDKMKGVVKTFSGMTDGYWKDIEPKGKKYMVLQIGFGDYVRSAGKSGGDLGYSDICGKFYILDGIDYKCNTAAHVLYYMEI